MERHYGHMIRILHWCTDQRMTNALEDMDLTAAQGHLMGYLTHRQEPACPKNVEEAFRLTHPTVSGLLSRLEKKGFIEFRPDAADRRCKRIHVLPKGKEYLETMHRTITENEEQLVRGFTDEEKAQFAAFLTRAIENMGGNPCQHKPKEEKGQ